MKKKSLFNVILELIIVIIIVGALSTIIDYYRMKNGQLPILNIKKYNEREKKQTFRGIFYLVERKITSSPREILSESKDVKFKVLIFNLNIPKFVKEEEKFLIKTSEISNCQEEAKLYFYNNKVKVYLYCIEDIKLTKNNKTTTLKTYLEKDINILDELDSKLAYLGLEKDQTTLVFKDNDNISNNGLRMLKCNKENINDIYLGPQNMEFQPDFCTLKNDTENS